MADNNNAKEKYEQSLEQLENLQLAMSDMNVALRKTRKVDNEISREIEELEKVLRKSVKDEDFLNEDDMLKALEDEEKKLTEELERYKNQHQKMKDSEERLSDDTEEDDSEGGEELPAELKRELERTTSNDANWNYPTSTS